MSVFGESAKQENIRERLREKMYNCTKTQKQILKEIGISQYVYWSFSRGCDVGRISAVKIEDWLKND